MFTGNRSIYRLSCSLLVVLLVSILTWNPTNASNTSTGRIEDTQNLAISHFLDTDGTLALPQTGLPGGIHTYGYQLISEPSKEPRFIMAPQAGLDDNNWESGYTLPGTNGNIFALAWDGSNLYVGGWFSSIGDIAANNIARWDGSNWYPLGTGTNNPVNALAWTGTGLYVGGAFTSPANGIAYWDGSNWSALSSGVSNGYVFSLAWDNNTNNLYVGGTFTIAGGASTYRIARWNSGNWYTLGSGIDSWFTSYSDFHAVYTLSWTGTTLYAGGIFTDTNGIAVSHIAQWDGSDWDSVGSGVNDYVWRTLWNGSDLFVGGEFTNASGVSANRIARWDGSNWNALGSGVWGPHSPYETGVWAMEWDGSNLFVGGGLTQAGGSSANYVARWDGSNWTTLSNGTDYFINVLLIQGSTLYAGGDFTSAGSSVASFLASWDGSNWQPLIDAGNGLNQQIYTLLGDSTDLYAGGDFNTAGNISANRIAHWNGNNWNTLGSGMNGRPLAMTRVGSSLYVGGTFTTAGGVTTNRIAHWNGSNWSTVGPSSGANNTVRAIAWDGTNLYIAGSFTNVGGVAASHVAQWNGTTWNSIGTGLDARVDALLWDGTYLYAAGDNSSSGGRVARWNGSTWTDLGGGFNGRVNALAWDSTYLYAGGEFTSPSNYIARWDSSTWSNLGSGANDYVNALAWDGTNLYAGGEFTSIGGISANRIARWDSSTWNNLASGLSGVVREIASVNLICTVRALAWDSVSTIPGLWVGGSFSQSGDKISNSIAHWRNAAIWDGGGSDNLASTPTNWSGDSLPLTTDVAIFNETSSQHAIINATFPITLAGIIIESGYNGIITQTNELNVSGDFNLDGGTYVLPDPTSTDLTVEGEFNHTNGTLRQSQIINGTSATFLYIEDGASNIKYRGINIDASISASNLGNVTASIRKPAAGEYCTTSGSSSPPYAGRCYTITATNDGPAHVLLWALSSELNGISSSQLSVYRYTTGWAELISNRARGTNGSYSYAEGDTPGFSSFLLGEENNGPTAIRLQVLQARPSSNHLALITCLLASISLLTLRLFNHPKTKNRLTFNRKTSTPIDKCQNN